MLDGVGTPALALLLGPASKYLLMPDNLKRHPSKPEGFYRAHCTHKAAMLRCSAICLTLIRKGEVRSCSIFNLLCLPNVL